MALTRLVTRANNTKHKWVKWVLGGIISVLIALAVWRLTRLTEELRRVRLAKMLAQDSAKDRSMQRHVADTEEEREQLTRDIEALETLILERSTREKMLAATYDSLLTAIDRAKTWKELGQLTRDE